MPSVGLQRIQLSAISFLGLPIKSFLAIIQIWRQRFVMTLGIVVTMFLAHVVEAPFLLLPPPTNAD